MISRLSYTNEHSVPHNIQKDTTQLPTVFIYDQVINFILTKRLINILNLIKAAKIDRKKLQKILIDYKIMDTKQITGYLLM